MTKIVRHSCSLGEKVFEKIRWEGYHVKSFGTDPSGKRFVELDFERDYGLCPECHQKCYKFHSKQKRVATDAPIDMPFTGIEVRFPVRRLRCACGHCKSEVISWIEPRARLTNRMVGYLQSLLRMMVPTSDISKTSGVSWTSIRRVEKQLLKFLFNELDMSDVHNLAIDEFLLHKGRRYATAVMDIENRRILWVCKGKTAKAIEPFFQHLKTQNLQGQIKSVSCDMNAVYPKMVKEHLPNATIVYDLFHVMKHLTEDVFKAARRQCFEQAKKKYTAYAKGSEQYEQGKYEALQLTQAEWILVMRQEQLKEKPKRQERLNELLQNNRLLAAVAPMADFIREIWSTKDRERSASKLRQVRQLLLAIASEFNFKPAKSFAMMLSRRQDGIIPAGQFGFTTNRLEGANNKIKVIKRTGYGYRDFDFFALKIKSLLPGIKNSPWTHLSDTQCVLRGEKLWQAPVWPSAC